MFTDDEDKALVELQKQQAEADRTKGYIGAAGSVLDNFANIPTAHEMLYKGKVERSRPSEVLSKAASTIADPMSKEQKAMEYMKAKRESNQMRAADDPMSGDADTYRRQIEVLAPSLKGKLDGMTLAQMERTSPILMAKIRGDIDRDNARVAAGQRASEAALNRDLRREELASKNEEKRAAAQEKKQASLTEVEDRRRNIEDNLTLLENMIKEKGTYELFGSHNADLDRRVEAIATDMAKLADPQSVARPAEVEAFKKGLIQSTATDMTNATALDILKNFRGEVGSRVSNAYKIRGGSDPGSQAARTGGGKQISKQERNKKTGEMRITYTDGTTEIVPSTAGRQ